MFLLRLRTALLKCNLPKIFAALPVLACNICYTLSWTMFPLRLHAALLKCKLLNYLQLRPPLLVTSAAQYLGLCYWYGFAPSLLKCKFPNYLQLCPVLAHYRRCCTMPRRWYYLQSCSLHFNKYGRLHINKYGLLHLARTGWKPKKNLAQSNALGTFDHLFCALKEQKEWGREHIYWLLLRLQRAS